MEQTYDAVVIGGGAAGLSGAVALARSRRSVLVVDAGEPRNAPAGHMHNYLGREGTPPRELLAIGRAEAAAYGAEIVEGRVTAVERLDGPRFRLSLADGRAVEARRLLVATGLADGLPDVTGLRERWGRDVLHCPYCHGYEVRDRALGVLATGPLSIHQALMWRQLSADVVFFSHTLSFSDEDREKLLARGIAVVDGEVAAVETADDRLTGVRLADGRTVARDALAVGTVLRARGELLEQLGLAAEEREMHGVVIGTAVPADPMGATSVPGVWVAGNVADMTAQVIVAAAAGMRAGAAINGDLVMADTADAVAQRRRVAEQLRSEQGAAFFDEGFWEERYAGPEKVWSGRPNPQLVAEAEGLAPGRALDVGCGEGADAVWLAARGWQVDGADISPSALKKAASHADDEGVGDRCRWLHADLAEWVPDAGAYDLVSAQFMHLPPQQLQAAQARFARAVAPGGSLLVVGHARSMFEEDGHHPAEMFFTADDVVRTLDPEQWEVVVAEDRAREGHRDGKPMTMHDTVVRARRRS
ncbi:methyltransferase domain-containing protein [Motilibacter deserti]|uniref:NAD(P)/FAD-dependent oxidoreductase n=1 Tax=Motilibacter deserti TaxID=2714956 RepID=A0ABX0GWP2_9ACTN|nr:NAD(P)/FAD-dependent oxidoreductase [Motilibacter deserti]